MLKLKRYNLSLNRSLFVCYRQISSKRFSLQFSLFLFVSLSLFEISFSAFETDKRVLSNIDYGVKYSFINTIKLNNMYFVINLLYTVHVLKYV